jgi:hypothetical protein
MVIALAAAGCGEVTLVLGPDGVAPETLDAGSYRTAILADAPLAYWRFDEQSGTTAADQTGNGNSALVGTGVTWDATGAVSGNTAAHLSGEQGFELEITNQFDFPGNDPYSLEGWVNPNTAADANFRHLFVKDDVSAPATGREEYGVYLQATDGLVFERYVMGTAQKLFAPVPALDQWTYVVATYDGTQMALYVDGVIVGTLVDTRSQASKDAPEFLGCKSFDYVSIQGTVDEFAIYDHALSAAQIASHWSASGR